MRSLRYWWNYFKLADSRHPSWIVTFPDGKRTYPQTRENADTLIKLFGGSMHYCRDERGYLSW